MNHKFGFCTSILKDAGFILCLPVTFVFFSYTNKNLNSPISDGNDLQNSIVVENSQYKTVKIGSQQWMSENLNVSVYRNGEKISEAKTIEEWKKYGNNGVGAWCYYNFDSLNGEKYGKLYNWFAIKDSRNITPDGWHVPDVEEWEILIKFLKGGEIAGGKLKESGYYNWHRPNSGATNESGFTALPGGYCKYNGRFFSMGDIAYFWTSYAKEPDNNYTGASRVGLSCIDYGVYIYEVTKDSGYSIRCVKK